VRTHTRTNLAQACIIPVWRLPAARAPPRKVAAVCGSGDLDPGAAGRERDHDRLVARPLHAAAVLGMFPQETVGRHQFIAEHQRRLAPDQDVADPAARTALPLRAQALDVAARHPDRSREFAGLPFEPPPAPEHERRESHDDDQIDAEDGKQCDHHGFPALPASAFRRYAPQIARLVLVPGKHAIQPPGIPPKGLEAAFAVPRHLSARVVAACHHRASSRAVVRPGTSG
jgi:hypothetical protein